MLGRLVDTIRGPKTGGGSPLAHTQVHFSCRAYRRASVIVGIAAFLSGCWVAPSATVRPQGKAGVVEEGIEVDRVADPATVLSVDRTARTVALSVRGVPLPACRIGPSVRNWVDFRRGDRVRATVREVLTVYVALRGSPDARVLLVDPSYRVLTVQYPNGEAEAYKIGLNTRMEGIEAGDSVAIRPVEVIELRRRGHFDWVGSSLPGRHATSAG